MGNWYCSAQRRAISRGDPIKGSSTPAPTMGVQRRSWMRRSRTGHFSKETCSSAKPGTYHRRPLRSRVYRAGTHQSGRSRTAPRAAATARSIWPSRCSSAKKTGMKRLTVSTLTFPCIASTAGTPTSASRGPSAASTPPSSLRPS